MAIRVSFMVADVAAAQRPRWWYCWLRGSCWAWGSAASGPSVPASADDSSHPGRRRERTPSSFSGVSVASVIGVPAGALAGAFYSWRAAFLAFAALGCRRSGLAVVAAASDQGGGR